MRVELIYNNDFGKDYIQDMNFESKEESKFNTYYHFSELETARKEMKKQVNRMVSDLDINDSFEYSRDQFYVNGASILILSY